MTSVETKRFQRYQQIYYDKAPEPSAPEPPAGQSLPARSTKAFSTRTALYGGKGLSRDGQANLADKKDSNASTSGNQ